jgi:hypothetical protein
MKILRHPAFLLLIAAYLSLGFAGLRFGLPDRTHLFSYSSDENYWIMAHNHLLGEGSFFANPKMHQPTLYLYIYLGALGFAKKAGYFTIDQVPQGELRTRVWFSRFYLMGRYLQLLFGLGVVAAFGAVTFRYYGTIGALLGTSLLALSPGFVAASHLSETNVLVTALAFASLALLMRDLETPAGPSHPWLRRAAFLAGLACAAKYSAFALAAPLVFAGWRKYGRLAICLESVGLMAIGFAAGYPYAWLAPTDFIAGFRLVSDWLKAPVPGFLDRVLFPFLYPFPYSLGPALFGVGLLSIAWALVRRDMKSDVLLIWLAAFLAGVYRVGTYAAPPRVLIAAPAIVFLIVRLFTELKESDQRFRRVIPVVACLLVGVTLLYTLTIVRLRRSVPPQKVASEWIWQHVPTGTPFGILTNAFYWTPDILYPTAPDIDGFKPLYPTEILKDIESARRLPFIVVAESHRHMQDGKVVSWLESGKEFALVARFGRELRFGRFRWRRPELPHGMPEHDLWMESLYIYANRSAVAGPKPSRAAQKSL